MNALPFSNDFTGETQEQCACCKSWGWPKEEIARLYSGEAVTMLCVDCTADFEMQTDRTLDSDELASDTAADLGAYIEKFGTPMERYLAEAEAELSARAFAALKRRIGIDSKGGAK